MDGKYRAFTQMHQKGHNASSFWNGTMRYKDLRGKVMSEVSRYYSFDKAMGPDRITEVGFRMRDKQESIEVQRFLEGQSQLTDLRTDLVLFPKKEEKAKINKRRPIAIMSHRTKVQDHSFLNKWGYKTMVDNWKLLEGVQTQGKQNTDLDSSWREGHQEY